MKVIDFISPVAPPPILVYSGSAVNREELLPKRDFFCLPVFADEVCNSAKDFTPRQTDVIITTPGKTGTTLLQQMTHQLRSGGDMSFADIYDVQPWILLNPAYRGPAQDVPQEWFPRVFKNHNRLMDIPGGRHIVTIRDPLGMLKSMYEFYADKKLPFVRRFVFIWLMGTILKHQSLLEMLPASFSGVLTPDEFASSFAWTRDNGFGGSLYDYIVEFWIARNDPNVLLMCYEDLVERKEVWIKAIGRFMGVPPSAERIKLVMNMTSKDFMREHESKFDESQIADEINKNGLMGAHFEPAVRVKTKSNTVLGTEGNTKLSKLWRTLVQPTTGFSSYNELCAHWKREVSSRRPELFAD